MDESILNLNDEEFKLLFQEEDLNKTINDILTFENDDDFQLIVSRVEKFNIELAEYLQTRRRVSNNNALLYNGKQSALINYDKFIETVREYSIGLRQIYDKYKKEIIVKLNNFKDKHGVSYNDFEMFYDNNEYGLSKKEFEKILAEEYSITQKKAREMLQDFKQIRGDFVQLKTERKREVSEYRRGYRWFLGAIKNLFNQEIVNAIHDIIDDFTKEEEINSDNLQKVNQSFSKRAIKVLISDFFQESPINFIKNINVIINFVKDSKMQIVSLDNLKLYLKIIKLYDEPNIDEIKELYAEMSSSNLNYMEMLYDDFQKARLASSKMLVDATYKPSDKPIKQIDGVPCYELKGEPFNMIIHGSSKVIDDFSKGPNDGISLSFISGDRLNAYNNGVIYAFDDLVPEQFVDIYKGDSYTKFNVFREEGFDEFIGGGKIPVAVPFFSTPQTLLNNTKENSYNELLYITQSHKYDLNIKTPKPSYIVCYDNVNDKSLEAAKKNNIPIVIIKTEYYPKMSYNYSGHFADISEEDTYKSQYR